MNVAIDQVEVDEDKSDRRNAQRYRAILFSLGKRAGASKGVGHSPAAEDDVFPDPDVETTVERVPLFLATLMLFLAVCTVAVSKLTASQNRNRIALGVLSSLVRVHGVAR